MRKMKNKATHLKTQMRKVKNKATHSKTQMRKMKNKAKSCEALLCYAERVKTIDFGNETEKDENVYCRLL